MKRTSIEWTDLSSNPLQYRDATGKVVWACVKKSAGCANCYSEAIAERFDRGGPFTRATMEGLTPFLDPKELKHILTAKTIGGKAVAGSRCFLGDMTDVFGEWVPDELLDLLFATIAIRSDVTFQILTKRPDRMRDYFRTIQDDDKDMNRWGIAACHPHIGNSPCAVNIIEDGDWPLRNLWLGTSVENQAAADERIPHLLNTPAAVRFLSCEPLLGPVDLRHWLCPEVPCPDGIPGCEVLHFGPSGLHQVIIGGESGPSARPMQIEWARSLVQQCRAANVAAFVKQLGSNPEGDTIPKNERDPVTGLTALHVRQVLTIRDRKGGDMAEFPEDLRVREFPEVPA